MSDQDQARDLLDVAARDPRALRGMSDVAVFADEVFGFVAQQAAEKSPKAWLAALGGAYPFTHDLAFLLARLAAAGQDVVDLWDLVDLNPFAVQLRYAALTGDDAPLDWAETTQRVADLYDLVQRILDQS